MEQRQPGVNEVVSSNNDENSSSPPPQSFMTPKQNLLYFVKTYWKSIIMIVVPIFLSPLVTSGRKDYRCGYVILVMAAYWVTECVPLPITGFLPVILFPCLDVMDSQTTCSCYMNNTIMVFLGGMILALGIEYSRLHMRIALGVIRIFGCSHRKLHGGLCVVTILLAMWISNTACTAMMVPIVIAVLEELEREGIGQTFEIPDDDPEVPLEEVEPKPTKVTKAYLMSTAYLASYGGTGTLVGTGTNLTFKGIYESIFPGSEGIDFTPWMVWAIPSMIINTVLTWFYMQIAYMGMFRPNSKDAIDIDIGKEGEAVANEVIRAKYNELGKLTWHEVCVGMLFILCIFLWFFRKPGFMSGWAEVLSPYSPVDSIRDSVPVIMIIFAMFVIPKNLFCLDACKKDPYKRHIDPNNGLISWKYLVSHLPWSLMFVLGGGFALSRASNVSCLSKRIGDFLKPLKGQDPTLVLFLVCISVSTLTEFTSNVGVANIILPVIANMCVAMEIHPLNLMIPATMVCSFSFRLPASTPPNAIISSIGNISTKDMIIGGCLPSVYSTMVVFALFPTWGRFVYDSYKFPEWAKMENVLNDTQCD